jgi:hypothetical protein
MSTITLENQTPSGEHLKATFLPEKGMNLISFKKGEIEVIEQTTSSLFEERYAGLGALIGPHFHRRKLELIPKVKEESLFPHIARVKAKGIHDPFSHGIARYAPWKVEWTQTKLKGTLSGKDTWHEIPLATLEGQQFKMHFSAELKQDGLWIDFSIVSDTDSLVGIHYYYALPNQRGRLTSTVQKQMRDHKGITEVPAIWFPESNQKLVFDLNQEADFTFRPYPNPLQGEILLETDTYNLQTSYQCINEENCWQLYRPAHASFVCIEPMSSQDPRHPNLSVSSIQIHLKILPTS